MKIEHYSIEKRSNIYLTYIGIGMIVTNILLKLISSDVHFFPTPYFGLSGIIALFLELVFFLVYLAMTITAAIVARNLHRSAFWWAFFTLLAAPLALIILGLKDVKIDERFKPILERRRSLFQTEMIKLRSSSDDISAVESCKRKHQELLTKELNARQTEIEKAEEIDWVSDSSKCPACGTRVMEKDTVCPDCGLQLE